jgi:ribonuclease E
MTPEEQDVYGMMGVSPLVRLNREVKNTRSVIVNVTAPGKLPPAGTLSENRTPDSESTALEPDRMALSVQPALESLQNTSDDTSPVAVITDENEANYGVPMSRRRRRRSSVTENRTEE